MDQHTDKEQEESSGVDRELLNLQSTNKPGLSESIANTTKERKRSQSTPLIQNRCAELINSIKQTLSKWDDVQLPLLPEDEEHLRTDYEKLTTERDELVEDSILLAEQLNKKGSIQEAKEVREVAKNMQQEMSNKIQPSLHQLH